MTPPEPYKLGRSEVTKMGQVRYRVVRSIQFIPVLITVVLWLLVGPVTSVWALPEPPHKFFGTVTIGASPADGGVSVEARIGNVQFSQLVAGDGTATSSASTESDGRYGISKSFQVCGDDLSSVQKEGGVNGDAVQFFVNGVLATTSVNGSTTSIVFERGGAGVGGEAVDLAISSLDAQKAASATSSEFACGEATLKVLNRVPTADALQVSATQGQAKAFELRAVDQDGDTLVFSIVTSPIEGSLSSITGTVCGGICTADVTTDSFTYKADDEIGDSNTVPYWERFRKSERGIRTGRLNTQTSLPMVHRSSSMMPGEATLPRLEPRRKDCVLAFASKSTVFIRGSGTCIIAGPPRSFINLETQYIGT